MLQGVQGGIDTQSLETILELKDLELLNANIGDTSRLDIRDFRAYNNSSSLSNFVLPQTTNRTNITNRSFRSGKSGGNLFTINGLAASGLGSNYGTNCNLTINGLRSYNRNRNNYHLEQNFLSA